MELLRPHDCLVDRSAVIGSPIFTRRRCLYGDAKPNKKLGARAGQSVLHKRLGRHSKLLRLSSSPDDVRSTRNNENKFLAGKITIVGKSTSCGDLLSYGIDRMIYPCREMERKQVRKGDPNISFSRLNIYAGSAFSSSPTPNSLPLPSFSKKMPPQVFDDFATRDLRRLLRLE